MSDTISRQAAIELAMQYCPDDDSTCSKADEDIRNLLDELEDLPSASEYEPAKLEDFAKMMSANTLYSFMAWYGEGLELMERYGFVICKKMM